MTGSRVLLDSSAVIRHFRNAEALTDKLKGYEELYISQITLGELFYGAYKSARPEENLRKIDRFLVAADVLAIDQETARQYGKIAVQLAGEGTPIPQNDIWIAAVAIQCDLPLATTDEHFRRVDGLTVLSGSVLGSLPGNVFWNAGVTELELINVSATLRSMSGLGVHFALTEDEVEHLRSLSDEREQLEHLQESIEPTYFEQDSGFMAETDRWWDPIHRALTDGRLNWASGEYPLSHTVLAGESLYVGTDYIMSLKTPDQVRDIAAALLAVTEEEFHDRYLRIDQKNYGFPLSEEDFQSTWEWFQEVRKLYGKAAKAGRFVLFTADQ